MKCYAKSSVNLIARLANLHPKTTFFIKVFSFVFLVPEKRIIFAKVQRRIKSKIRLSYRLSFKLLVVNQSNMLHREVSALIRSLKSGAKQIGWRTVSVGFRNLRGRYQDFLLYGWLPLYCWHLTCLGCFSGDCSQYRCSLPAGERFPCLENLVG